MAMRTRLSHELSVGRRPDAGFGLVSVMIAIVLLSVGVLSLSQLLTQSVSMQTIIATRTTALDVARSYMEEVKGLDPLTVSAQPEVRVNERGEADSSGLFTRELLVTTVSDHLIEATVIVTLPRSNPIRLVTWIYDGVY
jgi:type II secretory pathway component PulJ